MQVQQLLKTAAATLAEAGVEDSRLEAELLLRDCLGVPRSHLFLLHDQQVKPKLEQRFQEYITRRYRREPLQYILGSCEFWSLDFHVDPAVLIPRPETEFLLEHVFFTLGFKRDLPGLKILDLCTGSGVVGVVLAMEFDHAAVTAVDYSPDALAVARENIVYHGLEERINLVCADLLIGFKSDQVFDVIVTNPPYVKACDLSGLEPEVRDWEPELALSGGETGMDVINRICDDACCYLKPGGWLFMEIGADIGAQVKHVFAASERYEQVKIVNDWAGRPRVLQATNRKHTQ
ncbi:MAG: peptide chain release factor N(5)-glutamine methyltransferase [Deltaproteobacteria bacterium]|nr:peptide chain release factor N(5)-glutamine methyltransferase [Deltaproteobacteria bacterium]